MVNHLKKDLSKLSSYRFDLPESLIAQSPLKDRPSSRLMVIHRKEGRIEHRIFSDLLEYFNPGDLLVANNTKVIRARLKGQRPTGGKVEFLLLEQIENRVWEGICRSSANQQPGLTFDIPTRDGLSIQAELIRGSKESDTGTVVARFSRDPVFEADCGELPLPPYISRESTNGPTADDEDRYQTVFAKEAGSVAAPTAGLHFTSDLINRLKDKGVLWGEITLHIGIGTFRPVKVEDIHKHKMHSERYFISKEVEKLILKTKSNPSSRVVAIGTTSMRTLEGCYLENKGLKSGHGRTDIFIRPGYCDQFSVVDALITNFHLPESTLLMLVAAFAGYELIMKAYEIAVREKYRFFSYGDSMLIL
jgi:S-adenosylmethionine:tRNA ribosyltransferase-isomerase